MAVCTEVMVSEATKQYACVSGTCTEQAGGAYTEPTCAGACAQAGGSNTTLLLVGAAALGAFLLSRRGKGK